MKRQRTLFQAWKVDPNASSSSNLNDSASEKCGKTSDIEEILIDSDDDDDLLVQAMEQALDGPSTKAVGENSPCGTPLEDLPGFDASAGRTWIYPTNYPKREYQFSIVQSALFSNTLVILPTGLGKTFIAAVIMYNFYRWYPTGKIIFTAPTRPLVAQQIEACFKVMGIPISDTIEMTGTMPAKDRVSAWKEKRVFFLTPQVMMNDLSRGVCQAKQVKCLIIDEAHKALGNQAYCQIVRELIHHTDQFRIIALSATPGSDMNAVQQVLKNLLISHVELRREDSPDIQPYTFERIVEKLVIPLGEELTALKEKFLSVTKVYLNRLAQNRAMPNVNPSTLTQFKVLKLKEAFSQDPPMNITPQIMGLLQCDFSLLISLYHAYELLLQHGMKVFYTYLKGITDGEKSQPRVRYELLKNPQFDDIMRELQEKFGNDSNQTLTINSTNLFPTDLNADEIAGEPTPFSHPKLTKLEEIVLEHFRKFKKDSNSSGGDTRVMIFSQYRESVKEITAVLNKHRSLVKAMSFIGQNSSSSKGVSQKQQMLVVKKFREGGYNTLVSTCVGEEGLDIGEVDLIVCYDAPKSPIRLVQRMGRTGRKRQGRIIVLVTEGKEDQAYKTSNYKKRLIDRAISKGNHFENLYQNNPRMVPRGLNPSCHQMCMTVPKYTSSKKTRESKEPSRGCPKITSLIANMGKKSLKKLSGYLNPQEQTRYEAYYEVQSHKIPYLPLKRTIRTLDKPDATTENSSPGRPILSLDKWLPWQNILQKTKFVPHSKRTVHLTESLQFTGLLAQTNQEFDAYGLEMKTFLKPEYIEDVNNHIDNSDRKLSWKRKASSKSKSPRDEEQMELRRNMVGHEDDDEEEIKPRRKKSSKNARVIKSDDSDEDQEIKPKIKRKIQKINALDSEEDEGKPKNLKLSKIDTDKVEVKPKAKKKPTIHLLEGEDSENDCFMNNNEDLNTNDSVMSVHSFKKESKCEDSDGIQDSLSLEEVFDIDGLFKLTPKKKVLHTSPRVIIRTPPQLDGTIFDSERMSLSPVCLEDVIKKSVNQCNADYCLLQENQSVPYDSQTPNLIVHEINDSFEFLEPKLSVAFPDVHSMKSSTPVLPKNAGATCKTDFRQSEREQHNPDTANRLEPQKISLKLEELEKIPFISPILNTSTPCPKKQLNMINTPDDISPIILKSKTPVIVNKVKKQTENADSCWLDDSEDELFKDITFSKPDSAKKTTDLKLKPNSEHLSYWNDSLALTDLCAYVDQHSVADSHLIKKQLEPSSSSQKPTSRRNLSNRFLSLGQGKNKNSKDSLAEAKPSLERQSNVYSSTSNVCFVDENNFPNPSQSLIKPTVGVPSKDANHTPEVLFVGHDEKLKSTSAKAEVSTETRSRPGNCSSKATSVKMPTFNLSLDFFESQLDDDMLLEIQMPVDVQTNNTSSKSNYNNNFPNKGKDSDFQQQNFDRSWKDSCMMSNVGDKRPIPLFTSSGLHSSGNSFHSGSKTPVALVKPFMRQITEEEQEEKEESKEEEQSVLDEIIQMKKRKARAVIFSDSDVESTKSEGVFEEGPDNDSDNDFQRASLVKQKPVSDPKIQIKRTESRQAEAVKKKKPKQKRRMDGFIEVEADVSIDGAPVSSDESEGNSLDDMDESFIDDNHNASYLFTQPEKGVDNRAMYLKSLKSPVHAQPNKYKLKYNVNTDINVYSQQVPIDRSDYSYDSFCVDNSDIEYESDFSDTESPELVSKRPKPSARAQMKTKPGCRRIMLLNEDDSSILENKDTSTKQISNPRYPSFNINSLSDQPCPRVTNNHDFKSTVLSRTDTSCDVSLPRTVNNVNKPLSSSTSGSNAVCSDSSKSFIFSIPCVQGKSSSYLTKEERLRKQKEKQEEFRKKMSEKEIKSINSSSTVTRPISITRLMDEKRSVNPTDVENVTVVVDSKEISCGPGAVSCLRFVHHVKTVVRQIKAGDYLVSNRMAVKRLAYSDLTSTQYHSKLVEQVRHMCELYDRPCIILEKPRLKPGEKPKPFNRSKYFDSVLASLSLTHVKVLFSENQDETGGLLAELAKQETPKNMSIAIPSALESKEMELNFYLAIPKVNLSVAMNFVREFATIKQFCESTESRLQDAGRITWQRAHDIHSFVHKDLIL